MMKKTWRWVAVGLLMVVVFSLLFYIADRVTVVPEKRICFENRSCVWVRVAETPGERQKGLSGKKFMPQNVGMLFVFQESGKPGFWMKEMEFDLDFVWIRDGKVMDIDRNVSEQERDDEGLPIFKPKVEIDSMLEVNAGWTEKNGLVIGDRVL